MVKDNLLEMTADIVSAYVANNTISTQDVPTLITRVAESLTSLGDSPKPVAEKQEPAVSIRSSVKPDYIVCLEDGAKLKMLKRYLRTKYNMSPEDYRAKWGLPRDYPMVAPNYTEARRSLAHKIGLGRKTKAATPDTAENAEAHDREATATPKRSRKTSGEGGRRTRSKPEPTAE